MALSDLKKEIVSEAHGRAEQAESEAREEARRILDDARATAKKNLAEARQALLDAEKASSEQAEADAQTEATEIIQNAVDAVIEGELRRVRGRIQAELAKNHMKELVANATKRFREVANPSETMVEITKRHAPLVKNVSRVVPVKEEGHLVFRTKDGKVSLDSSASTLVEANIHSIKAMLTRSMEL